jgi:hypothetical protein
MSLTPIPGNRKYRALNYKRVGKQQEVGLDSSLVHAIQGCHGRSILETNARFAMLSPLAFGSGFAQFVFNGN